MFYIRLALGRLVTRNHNQSVAISPESSVLSGVDGDLVSIGSSVHTRDLVEDLDNPQQTMGGINDHKPIALYILCDKQMAEVGFFPIFNQNYLVVE